MKHWIARHWITLATIFGWGVPSWIRKQVPDSFIDDLSSRESQLTEALKAGSPRDLPAPAFLEQRIERAVVQSGEGRRKSTRWTGLLFPASAFAAAVVIGFIILTDQKVEQPDIPDFDNGLAVVETAPVEAPSKTLGRIGQGLSTLEEGLILKPLAMEQKRLAADVASALKFVSSSVLPDSYASDVNSRLDALGNTI